MTPTDLPLGTNPSRQRRSDAASATHSGRMQGKGMAANTISLLLGHPDPATLLPSELRNAMQQVLSSPQSSTALQYAPEQGTHSLINVLVEKINREQGLALQSGNLMVVAGSTHAVDMLARLYARPGGVVLVEAPTYVDAIHIFRDH